MSIQRCLAKFDQNVYFRCFCVQLVSQHACPNFRTTCAMALQHELELSTLPSIPFNGHVGGL